MPPRAGPLLPGPASPGAPRPGLGTRQRIPTPPCARSPRSSPAHDLVCQEDPAHLGVLVLPFVDDGLRGERGEVRACSRSARTAAGHRARAPRWAGAPGAPGLTPSVPLGRVLGGAPGTSLGVQVGTEVPPPPLQFLEALQEGRGKKYIKTILR